MTEKKEELKENQKEELKNKPLGSGIFATVIGGLLLLLAVFFYCKDETLKDLLTPKELLNIYLIFSGVTLLGWGINRIVHNSGERLVAKDTINFVFAIIATAIAIISIMIA